MLLMLIAMLVVAEAATPVAVAMLPMFMVDVPISILNLEGIVGTWNLEEENSTKTRGLEQVLISRLEPRKLESDQNEKKLDHEGRR